MYEYACTVLDVIDDDTLCLDLDLGFNIHVRQTVHLSDVAVPRTAAAPRTIMPGGRDRHVGVLCWLGSAHSLVVRIDKDHQRRDGGYVGTVYRDDDPEPLNAWVARAGRRRVPEPRSPGSMDGRGTAAGPRWAVRQRTGPGPR